MMPEHSPLLPLARLWAKTSAKGTPYMVGRLVWRSWCCCLSARNIPTAILTNCSSPRRMMPRIKQQPKAHHPSGTRRLLRTGTRYRSAE